jgi:hypothetical protein
MQQIFHHNSSGNAAFTGDLLSREVLRATSLHPIKLHEHQYRLHNFLNMRKIIDLRQRALELKRHIFKLKRELLAVDGTPAAASSAANATVDSPPTQSNIEIYSEFENLILKKSENLSMDVLSNRFHAEPSYFNLKVKDAPTTGGTAHRNEYDFDFFTRSMFSSTYISPKRGLEGYWKRSLIDSVRQIMEDINANSKERGRIIDFKNVLYGYTRHHPLVGLDYIIDILLVYRKYEGRKMTVPVRRHAYVRSTYSDLIFREDSLTSSVYAELPAEYKLRHMMRLGDQNNEPLLTLNETVLEETIQKAYEETEKEKKRVPRSILGRISDWLFQRRSQDPDASQFLNLSSSQENNEYEMDMNLGGAYRQRIYISKIVYSKSVNFVLPITGRCDVFRRFMVNYENVCLRTNENTKLAIVLFESEFNSGSLIKDEQSGKVTKQSVLILNLIDFLKRKYPDKVNDDTLRLITSDLNFSRSIGCELGAAFFKVTFFFKCKISRTCKNIKSI